MLKIWICGANGRVGRKMTKILKSQPVELTVKKILSLEGEELDAARHPMQKVRIPCSRAFAPGSIVRKDKEESR